MRRQVVLWFFALGFVFLGGCSPPAPQNDIETSRFIPDCLMGIMQSPEFRQYLPQDFSFDVAFLPEDSEEYRIVEAVAQRVIQHRYKEFPWKLKIYILDSDDMNAFTLGGGYLFVSKGLFALVRSEAGLAGILGHEFGHMIKMDQLDGYRMAAAFQAYYTDPTTPASTEMLNELATQFVELCTTIPGLVPIDWKSKGMEKNSKWIQTDTSARWNEKSTSYVPYAFEREVDSPYEFLSDYHSAEGSASWSYCDHFESADVENDYETLTMNPDFYRQMFPDLGSLISPERLWPDLFQDFATLEAKVQQKKWLNFHQDAFSRYKECQADELGGISALAAGYFPTEFTEEMHDTSIEVFDEVLTRLGPGYSLKPVDVRDSSHPSDLQRMIGAQEFFMGEESLQSNLTLPDVPEYQTLPLRLSQVVDPNLFQVLHEEATERTIQYYTELVQEMVPPQGSAIQPLLWPQMAGEKILPLQMSDVAEALSNANARFKSRKSNSDRCQMYREVFEDLTGAPYSGPPLNCPGTSPSEQFKNGWSYGLDLLGAAFSR